ncbi:MAG: futalosine hydrolase [Ferruginibacter sp.]
MNTLVAAATELEIASFRARNPAVPVFIHGVGAAHAVFALTQKLAEGKYSRVIQAGIAGSFLPELELGEVVAVKQDRFADLGVLEQGKLSTVFEMGLAKADDAPYKKGWLKNEGGWIDGLSCKKLNGVTVNLLNADAGYATMLRDKYDAAVESMEGAALHYVCLQMNIPFLQLRAISNYVGERDKTKWKMEEAVRRLGEEVELRIMNYEL